MKSILLINPNTSARSTEMMLAVAKPLLPAGVALRGIGAAHGADMILDEAALAVAETEVVRIGTEAHPGSQAIVVAAFGNPGAHRLREMLAMPVVGIGEAAMREAAAGGRRFGIATTTPGLVRSIEAGVRHLGWKPVSPACGFRPAVTRSPWLPILPTSMTSSRWRRHGASTWMAPKLWSLAAAR